MKISKKDAKLLYIVGGILLFAVLYMYVYKPMQDENKKMLSEIESLNREYKTLELQYAQKSMYEAKIEEYKAAMKEDMLLFPAEINEEDIIAYILNLQDAHEIEVMSIGFQEPMELVNFNGVIEVEGAEQKTKMQGQRIDTVASIEVSYEELKNVLQYIYETQTQTTLESVTLSYNEGEETLSGAMNFSRYILSYEEAEYVPEVLPEVEIGQEDPFGED